MSQVASLATIGTHMGHTIGSGSVQGGSQSQISKFKLGAEIKENESAALNKAYDSSTAYLSSLKGVFSKTGQEQFNHSFSNAYQKQLQSSNSAASNFKNAFIKQATSTLGVTEEAAASMYGQLGIAALGNGVGVTVKGGSKNARSLAQNLLDNTEEGKTLTTSLAKTASAIKNNMGGKSSNFTTSGGTSEDVARAEQEMVKDTATLSAMQSYSKSHSVEESVDMNSLVISGKNTAKGQAAIENLVRYMQKNHADELKERTEHLKPIVGGDGRLATEMAAFEIGQNSSDRETSLMTTNAALTALGFNPDADDTITSDVVDKATSISNTATGNVVYKYGQGLGAAKTYATTTGQTITIANSNIPGNGAVVGGQVAALNKEASEKRDQMNKETEILNKNALVAKIFNRSMTNDDYNNALNSMNIPKDIKDQLVKGGLENNANNGNYADYITNTASYLEQELKAYNISQGMTEENAATAAAHRASVYKNVGFGNVKTTSSFGGVASNLANFYKNTNPLQLLNLMRGAGTEEEFNQAIQMTGKVQGFSFAPGQMIDGGAHIYREALSNSTQYSQGFENITKILNK